MMRVLNAVGLDDFNMAVVHFYGEAHAIDRVAGLDLLQNAWIPRSILGCFVKASFNAFKET